MALTRANAPTTAVAEEAVRLLNANGYESYNVGWNVFSVAGESKVRSVIVDITIGQRLAVIASGGRNV